MQERNWKRIRVLNIFARQDEQGDIRFKGPNCVFFCISYCGVRCVVLWPPFLERRRVAFGLEVIIGSMLGVFFVSLHGVSLFYVNLNLNTTEGYISLDYSTLQH